MTDHTIKPLSRAQLNYLRERIANARTKLRRANTGRHEPAAVRKARTLLKRFEAAQYKRGRQRCAKIDAAASKVEESILFAGHEAALAAIAAFEKLKI